MNTRPNFRLIVITTFCLLTFVLILIKLVKVQILQHPYYEEKARKNKLLKKHVDAPRGTIFDRHGRELAKDVIQFRVAIRRQGCQNLAKVINHVSKVLDIPVNVISNRIKINPKFAYIDKRVSPEEVQRLRELKDPGIEIEKIFLRVYPYKENGAHFVGFCGSDNVALGGIEHQYNRFLQGKAGWKYYLRDAYGNQAPNLDYVGEDPINGLDVVLTVDMDYQEILSVELKKAVEINGAQEGVALLVASKTGEILSVANFPQFDPNFPDRFSDVVRKNKAVTDIIEPGSTLKFVALACALENLDVDLEKSIYFCENGLYKLRKNDIHDYEKFGWLSLRKIIENSSNIGTIKFVEKLDRKTFYRYIRNFGFGMSTGIDLPGESPGILQSLSNFSATTLYYMSIGYEIGVTPLQLAMAYSALANEGSLLKPYLMKQILNENHRVIVENKPQVIRQVISPKTTELIKSVLVGVVKNGTGKNAFIDNVTVAGKTGTAQLYNPQIGRHDNTKHVASFVGYFPAENPHFTLLVMLKKPKMSSWGGVVAAPIFKNMAERIYSLSDLQMENYALKSDSSDKKNSLSVPNVEGLAVKTAEEILTSNQYRVDVVGEGTKVEKQIPIKELGKVKSISLYTEDDNIPQNQLMPTLKGLSLKEALAVLHNFQIVPSVEGYGIVVRQTPVPGARIKDQNMVKLVCKPT